MSASATFWSARHREFNTVTEPAFYTYPFEAAFSEAVQIGDVIYLSGHIGDDDDGLLAQGFEAEFAQMMTNVEGSLARFNLGFEALVSLRVMLSDMSQLEWFNQLLAERLTQRPLPVISAFEVKALALGAAMEIECVAQRPV